MDLVTWIDNVPVSMMSTIPFLDCFSMDENGSTVYRKLKNVNGTWYCDMFYRPEIFKLYEENMGGVDLL